MLVSCNAPPLPLDKAVSDVRNIKAKVEDVSQRNTRYNLILDSGSNSKPVSLVEQIARANTGPSAFRMLREVWEATGKCHGMGDLQELIKSGGSDREVIPIWGSTGPTDPGVTSILMKAYNDPEICHGFKTRAWVKLTTPFNPDEFLKSLLTQVYASSNEASVGAEFRARMKAATDMEDDHLKAELMQQLMSGLRYFIILEEVSTVVEWDIIKWYLPDTKDGSRLIVSTKKLQIALLCISKPYKVTELAQLSEDQSLCAFSKKSGRRAGKGELIWQIGCRGVISLWGTGDLKSALAHNVYTSIMYKSKQFHGVEFERHSWVDVPCHFNPEVFSRRLLLNFRSQDFQVEEISAVGMMRNPALTEECCKILRENDCLVVINGLQSTEDWDWIKDTFLSQPIKGCIVVITNEEHVAKHCVEDEDGALSIKDLEADPVLHALIKGARCYGIDGKEAYGTGRIFSIRKEEAREWFQKLGPRYNRSLLKHPVRSFWGTDSARNSNIVRQVYYGQIFYNEGSIEHMYEEDRSSQDKKELKFGWVDVHHPFDLTDFSCRLVLDFHSDDLQSKRSAAVGIMEGQDPIEVCRMFLREYRCLVVIDGVRDRDDWDEINDAFKFKLTEGCTIVITNAQNVAKYVAPEKNEAIGDTMVVPPLIKMICKPRKLRPLVLWKGQDPIQGCCRILHQHKCLIVIDGLRSMDDWDLIKGAFLLDDTKSSIVVITNEKSVATHCVKKEAQVVNVKGLDSGRPLFKKITKDLTHDEAMLSERIIGRCGGILKVITVIGEVIAKATYLLNHINGDFMGTIDKDPKFHGLRGLFAWMQSYFDACSDSVKPCIFYLSVFPAKHNIRRRRLLRRWMAEGYSRDTFDRIAEENGEKLFAELIDLSIIQHLETSVPCQVNGFFHEYIISRPMEDNLVFALDGRCSLNSQHAGQHLTIRKSLDGDEVVFRGIDVSRLRSLTVFGKWKSTLISEKMRLVRVLDLEDASHVTNDDLELIGKLLPRLKFLSLRGHEEIGHLPESLCGLIQLQTLDVRGTSIVTLPRDIRKLQKLSYIRAGTKITLKEGDDVAASLPPTDVVQTSTPPANVDDTAARVQEVVADEARTSTAPRSKPRTLVSSWLSKFRKQRHGNQGGVKVHAGNGIMTGLHTLGVVAVSVSGGKAILKELKKLTQLRKLGVSGINRENWKEFCSVISGHGHMESLSVRVEEDKDGPFACFVEISEPPKTLKSLKAYGHVQISPVWLAQLTIMRKVDFGLTISTQEDIDNLFYTNCRVVLDKNRFLEIYCTSGLQLTFSQEDPLRKVEVLKVQCPCGSSLRISGLENLRCLKEVWLKGSYNDGHKQDLEREIREHPKKPVLKLEEPRSS